MSMVNISIVGNLARTPEQICFASGRVKTIMVVAVNGAQAKTAADKDKSAAAKADFYRVEIWGKLAELATKYLDKGNQVAVCGRLIMEHWTDREGHERLTPVVSATQLSFPPRMTRKSSAGNRASSASKPEDEEDDDAYEDDDAGDLFAGARAVTVAEPPAQLYQPRSLPPSAASRARLSAVAN